MAFADVTPEMTLKVILLGDTSVGKTCLMKQFISGDFTSESQTTVGVGYGAKNVEVKGGRIVRLQIWDTVSTTQAGQEAFRSITRSFYRGANAACVVYSITNKSSFMSIPQWIADLRTQGGSAVIYLVGNMNDLGEKREVDAKSGKSMADQFGLNGFFEVSAKTGDNVTAALSALADDTFLSVWQQLPRDDQSASEHNNEVVSLSTTVTPKPTKCCK